MSRLSICAWIVAALAAAGAVATRADEMSSDDKLRILYSNRFTFTDRGMPLVTIELMSGQRKVTLSGAGGLVVLPDGDTGPEVRAGGDTWTVEAIDIAPAVVREWTVVAHVPSADRTTIDRAVATWTARGFRPQRFEIGAVFAVDGEMLDGRETLVAIAPVRAPGGAAQAARIAREHDVDTSVHRELERRPRGTLIARSGDAVVRNSSVLWFAPVTADGTITVHDVTHGHGGSQLDAERRETRNYFGQVYVTLDNDGRLTVVNAVEADRLLAGLVPSEIFPDAADEALAAQAIAARTELLSRIGTRHLTDPYLLCSSQHCQVYSGAGREHPRTTAAVRATRGQVLLRETGGLVDARYSASCGGHGEHNDNIWGGRADPALRGHVDAGASSSRALARFSAGVDDDNIDEFLSLSPEHAYCGTTRYAKGRFRWRAQRTAAELDRLVAEHYPQVGTVRNVVPLTRGVSGRITRLRIDGNRSTVEVSGDLHIRRLLGGLKSALFTVDVIGSRDHPDAFVFRGAGFGHGAGMCQTGAIGMAEAGLAHTAILKHYYRGARLQRFY